MSPVRKLAVSRAHCAVAALVIGLGLGCSESLGTDDGGGFPTFDGFSILVTALQEQAAEAPSNGAVALVPLLQWQGPLNVEPTSGTVIVQMVTSAGAALGSPVNLGNNAGDLPGAAFDGTNFLVVYQLTTTGGTDLYGQFFAPSGAASSAAFPITATHDAPVVWSVSYGAGTYLVTYHRITTTVSSFARMISPAGVVSAEIPVGDRGGRSTSAFGGTQFLIAYVDTRTQILGRFIQPNGTLGTTFAIDASAGASNDEMHAAWNGTNFLVAFSDSSAGTGWDVLSQAISPTGTLVGGHAIIAAGATTELSRGILADGSNFLVTWFGGPETTRSTYGTFIDGSGAVIGSSHLLFNGSPATIVAPITSKLGTSYLAIVNRKALSWDVFGKLLPSIP